MGESGFVRNARIITVIFLLGFGLLGAYFGVRGQDPRFPWPPRPVKPPADFEQNDPGPSKAPVRAPVPQPPTPRVIVPEAAPAQRQTLAAAANPTPPIEAPPPVPSPVPPPLAQSAEALAQPPTAVKDKQEPSALPPAGEIVVDVSPRADVNTQQTSAEIKADVQPPTVTAPSVPTITNMPDKADEPLVVLPPAASNPKHSKVITPPSAPGPMPTTISENPEPLLPGQPSPKSVTPPDLKAAPESPRPLPRETQTQQAPAANPPTVAAPPAPAHEAPPKPRVFQLVNPIRRPENKTPVTLPEPAVLPERQPDQPAPERPLIQAQPVAQTHPSPAGPQVTGNMTPQVTVEKRGPAQLRAGQALQFTIVLHNTGATPANQIRVEDEVPLGTRVLFADPQPVVQNDRAVWIVPALAPGAEKQLKIELQAQAPGELIGLTSVHVTASTNLRMRIDAEILSLSVKPVPAVPVGFPLVLEVQVTNHGKKTLNGLVLRGVLPSGLTHPAGKEIEADVGALGPGASKTYKMPVKAAQPGRHTIDVQIVAPGGFEATGQGTVQVTQGTVSGLSIQQQPGVRLVLDKEAELRIEVANHTEHGQRNVSVLDRLPEGVEFVAASDQGLFRPDARFAHWLIDYLEPGQARTLTLRVQPTRAGQFANEVTARTDNEQETRSTANVHVLAQANLVVKIADRDSAIEVGKPAVYEIKVTNRGSAPATGIQVQATIPDGMAPAQARGPTQHRLEGRQVIFASLPKLGPQGEAVYYVTALAQAQGDQRFRALVMSDQETAPIAREERTYVYHD
jgi:uncharacterized repeat protein (TIGR01451 family)